MKLLFSFAALLFLILPVSSASEVAPDVAQIKREIDAQISRGRAEFKSCARFKKQLKKIVPGGLSIDSPSHLNRKQALDYLAVLEKYPAPPRGFEKAMDLYLDHLDLLLKEPDQAELLEKLGKVEEECAMFSVLVHASLLFKDVKVFSFSKKEKSKVERMAKAYLTSGLPFHNFFEIGVKGTVLKNYLEHLFEGENRDQLLVRVNEYLKNYDMRRDAAFVRAKQVKAEGKSETLEYFRFHWTEAKSLSEGYSALVKDAAL